MPIRSRHKLIGTFLLAAVCSGCVTLTPPPSIAPTMPRRGIIPRSYKMKLAVFNLLDPTGSGGKLSESIAETLHVALFQTNRFELMQRAELRGIDASDTRKIQEEYANRLDGLVVGSITHFNTAQKTMTLNINVMNPFGTTMTAQSFEDIRYTGSINVDANRDDIVKIAEWIDRKFPKLEDGSILSLSSNRITINLGSKDGVQVGMWVLVAARGDDIKDPTSGELLSSNIYVAEAWVVAVNPGTCEALLATVSDRNTNLKSRRPRVKVGDKVVFK